MRGCRVGARHGLDEEHVPADRHQPGKRVLHPGVWMLKIASDGRDERDPGTWACGHAWLVVFRTLHR